MKAYNRGQSQTVFFPILKMDVERSAVKFTRYTAHNYITVLLIMDN